MMGTIMGATFSQVLWAQGDGSAGIREATRLINNYFEPLTKLVYGIGALVGLVGAIRVYQKFSSGDPDTAKSAASWGGACVFLIICGAVLSSFFRSGV